MNPAAWWSPTLGYLVPAVGSGDGPWATDGRVKRVSDNYVVEVPADAVELGPLAVDVVDLEDALGFYDVSDDGQAERLAAYLTERRTARARLAREYAARPERKL